MANPRRLLRNQLKIAWESTIRDVYDKRLINSERELQWHFCQQLKAIFDGRQRKLLRRLFIEPSVKIKGDMLRSPDVLICNSTKIIGAIEFKYTPRKKAATKKDLETLRQLKVQTEPITVTSGRYRGSTKLKEYTLARDAVLCWAAVHAQDECPLPKVGQLKIDLGLLCLEARTNDEDSPAIFVDDHCN